MHSHPQPEEACPPETGSFDANQTLQRFASCLVHNVNNPMAAIIGCAQLLERILQPDSVDLTQCRAYVEIIETEAQRCARMLDRLASLARPPRARCARLNIHALLEEAVASFSCPEGIHIHLECAAQDPHAAADASLLTQILANLLENAAEAMPEGGDIFLRAEESPRGEEWLRVAVTDTGPGIPEDALPQVTEPFFSTRPGHNGIGLALCRQLATLQGGNLQVTNAPARGVRVTLDLPRQSPLA